MAGPVLTLELLLGGRRLRNYSLRWCYGGWLLLQFFVLSAAFLIVQATMPYHNGFAPEAGRYYVDFVVRQQFLLLMLVTPALLAGAVADEKSSGTLQYLLSADLTVGEILLGKLLALRRLRRLAGAIAAPVPLPGRTVCRSRFAWAARLRRLHGRGDFLPRCVRTARLGLEQANPQRRRGFVLLPDPRLHRRAVVGRPLRLGRTSSRTASTRCTRSIRTKSRTTCGNAAGGCWSGYCPGWAWRRLFRTGGLADAAGVPAATRRLRQEAPTLVDGPPAAGPPKPRALERTLRRGHRPAARAPRVSDLAGGARGLPADGTRVRVDGS